MVHARIGFGLVLHLPLSTYVGTTLTPYYRTAPSLTPVASTGFRFLSPAPAGSGVLATTPDAISPHALWPSLVLEAGVTP
jgi:hypothetical protein